VKIAASLGEYAQRRGYHLHLLADESAWPPPPGPLSLTALLEYLARVQPTGAHNLQSLISNPQSRITQYFICLLPYPTDSVIDSLVALKQQGREILTVVLDPGSFPAGGPSGRALADGLASAGVESRLIRFGRDWVSQLIAHDSIERVPRI
jgi:hypothetical protein